MLEWYDFFLFGILASVIAPKFFPAADQATSMLYTLASFSVAFVVRPLGGIIFGHIGDTLGRKPALIWSIALMGIASTGMGFLPSYQQIGINATILIVFLRIIQGIAVGAEYAGSAIYLAENTPRKRRGYLTSYLQAGASMGFLFSLIVTVSIKYIMGEDAYNNWAWRIAFYLSALWILPAYHIRSKLYESPMFQEIQKKKSQIKNPFIALFKKLEYRKIAIISIVGLTMGQGIVSYAGLYSMYFLEQYQTVPHRDIHEMLIVSSALGMIFYILVGYISDKIGNYKHITLLGMLLFVLTYIPLFDIMHNIAENYDVLSKTSSAKSTIIMLLILQKLFFSMVYAPLVVLLVDIFPIKIRHTGISISYNIGNGIFGGLFPAIATYLGSITIFPDYSHLNGSLYPLLFVPICMVTGYYFIPSYHSKRYKAT